MTVDECLTSLGSHPNQIEVRSTAPPFNWVSSSTDAERERNRINRSAMKLLADPRTKLSPLAHQLVEQHCPLSSDVFELVWRKVVSAPTQECAVCKQLFFGKRSTAKYCSRKCEARAYRKRRLQPV